jgi:hypothetical protein
MPVIGRGEHEDIAAIAVRVHDLQASGQSDAS